MLRELDEPVFMDRASQVEVWRNHGLFGVAICG